MKAALYTRYGPPEVVQLANTDKPTPTEKQVLLRVRAASINPYDWHFMRGLPYGVRLAAGFSKPKDPRLGVDVSGVVDSVGASVTQFRPGDPVFGSCRGAFAEFACAQESAIVAKPSNITFEQAAAVPIAALTALQGLRLGGLDANTPPIQPARKVLVNGASGGVGTFAAQIAHSFGAEVTGVCSTRNLELVFQLGATRVIDYTRENFTKTIPRTPIRYDIFFDAVGNHSLSACTRVLNPTGVYIPAGGTTDNFMFRPLARALSALLQSKLRRPRLIPFFVAKSSQADLAILQKLLSTGKVTPVIDRQYPLADISEAIRYLETGHARGKVILTP